MKQIDIKTTYTGPTAWIILACLINRGGLRASLLIDHVVWAGVQDVEQATQKDTRAHAICEQPSLEPIDALVHAFEAFLGGLHVQQLVPKP